MKGIQIEIIREAVECFKFGEKVQVVAERLNCHPSYLSECVLRLTGHRPSWYKEEARQGQLPGHPMPENSHPCGLSKSSVRICLTQCHLAHKCEAAKVAGVTKDRNGCRIIPDILQFKLTKREAYY